MAKRQVFEITCDRCARTETQPLPQAGGSMDGKGPEFEMMFQGSLKQQQLGLKMVLILKFD